MVIVKTKISVAAYTATDIFIYMEMKTLYY